MNAVRKRLTYANVVSSLALFLVVAGGSAFAASQLGKNSVGAKQLKKNAVTAAKLKKNAVTADKIKPGAVTGAKIDLKSLGTVPHAATASTAGSAANAANANVAANLHGYSHNSMRMTPIPVANYNDGVNNSPETPLFSSGPITISAKCFTYGTSTYAMFFIRTTENGTAFWAEYNDTSGSESSDLLSTSTPAEERILRYESTGSEYAYYEAEESEFAAMGPNGTTVRGGLQIGVKGGELKGGGQGPYGPGKSCLMAGNMFTL